MHPLWYKLNQQSPWLSKASDKGYYIMSCYIMMGCIAFGCRAWKTRHLKWSRSCPSYTYSWRSSNIINKRCALSWCPVGLCICAGMALVAANSKISISHGQAKERQWEASVCEQCYPYLPLLVRNQWFIIKACSLHISVLELFQMQHHTLYPLHLPCQFSCRFKISLQQKLPSMSSCTMHMTVLLSFWFRLVLAFSCMKCPTLWLRSRLFCRQEKAPVPHLFMHSGQPKN